MIVLFVHLSCHVGYGDEHPQPTVSSSQPQDVEIPGGFSGDPIAFFDDLSWRSFIALNWPAKDGERGEADPIKTLGDPSNNVVWETWKADYELLQPNGQRPSEWDSFSTVSPCTDLPLDTAGHAKILGTSGHISTAISHYNQMGLVGASGTLIAQNRTYTRFEIRMNRREYDFIRGVDTDPQSFLYLAKNLPAVNADPIVFPAGSMEVKAAWREFKLPEEASLLPRYYVRKTVLVDPPANDCRNATAGLVGLHIVHRTPSRREWVWSSFEHIDNLDAPDGIRPTYRDPDITTGPVNVLEAIVDDTHPPKTNPTRTQVKRIKAIHDSTKKTNERYRNHEDVSGTVWKNYQLVMTQWPTMPAASDSEFKLRSHQAYPQGAGTPFPMDTPGSGTSISNVTMETPTPFQQQFSCMRCHFSRVNNNTEFVWFLRLRAFDPDEVSVAAKQRAIAEFSKRILNEAQ